MSCQVDKILLVKGLTLAILQHSRPNSSIKSMSGKGESLSLNS